MSEVKTLKLNIGPQHPATHGVLRLVVELDGEIIVSCEPVIGYLHRGLEKMAESRTYLQYLPLVDRVDYLSGFFNSYGYVKAVEKLLNTEISTKAKCIRVIMMEFNRITSHLMWLGSMLLDMGATSPLFYAFREREDIQALLEEYSGGRMMFNAFSFGGIRFDLPDGWVEKAEKLAKTMPKYFDEYEDIITQNPIVLDRTVNIGVIPKETAIKYGLTGANLRASGIDIDYRITSDESIYDDFKFSVPVLTKGDCYSRYLARMKEMRESLKIILQALDLYKKVQKEELNLNKVNQSNIKLPKGEVTTYTEAPRGLYMCHLISDGTNKPYRVKHRTGSFATLQALGEIAAGNTFANLMPIIGSLDFVLPEADR